MKNDLKAQFEMLDLAKEDYSRIRTNFITDAEANYEAYKQDLNYLVAIDILKASDFMLNCYSKLVNTVVETQNDLTHQEIDNMVETTLKTNKEIDKELRPSYMLDPTDLKEQFDTLLKAFKNG